MANIGVIGASGFVGQHLSRELLNRGHTVRAIVRSAGSAPAGSEEVALGDFVNVTGWEPALRNLDAVFCLAARAHITKESAAEPLAEFRRINVQATANIASASAEVGLRRFIFLSSIGVNGEVTSPGFQFSAADVPNPQAPYAISKLEAENLLLDIHQSGALDVVVVRSPLVYGPGARGNFLRLLQLVHRGIPLPLASAHNPRAMIAVDNLSDALIATVSTPRAEKMVALVNDQETFSTATLVRHIASSLNKPGRLLPCPPWLLKAGMSLVGMGKEAGKLVDPLEVRISATWPDFDWQPPLETAAEIHKAAEWYLDSVRERA